MMHPQLSLIVGLERQVWDALVHGDANADTGLLSDDFLGVYETGFSDKAGHVGQLDSGPSIGHYDLSDFHLFEPGPGLAMLCYRADFARLVPRDGPAEAMLVSSLWQQTPKGWRNIFSQDTPLAKGAER